MADDTPKIAKPRKSRVAADTVKKPRTPAKPKPAKPLKGPTVDTTTEVPPITPESDAAPQSETANTIQSLKDNAAQYTKGAADKARAYADEGKARAGGMLDEISRLLTEAASTVDEKLGEQYGHYARSAAGQVSGFSESLKAKDMDELIEDARGFVQKSPAIAIGTAAALGFVLMRLVKSGIDASDTGPTKS